MGRALENTFNNIFLKQFSGLTEERNLRVRKFVKLQFLDSRNSKVKIPNFDWGEREEKSGSFPSERCVKLKYLQDALSPGERMRELPKEDVPSSPVDKLSQLAHD